MGPLKTRVSVLHLWTGIFLFLSGGIAVQPAAAQGSPAPTKSLFTQSALQLLERDFARGDVSFLLLDARTGALLSSRWDDPQEPIPLGSLVKPFTALAYAEEHHFRYPVHICAGVAGGCWQQHPHGRLGIVSAIAYSCNSYFREVAANLTGEQMLSTAAKFGLDAPEPDLTGPPLMGLGEEWPISPLHMARAYLELYRRRGQPGVRDILFGMAQSAERGTGAGVGRALKHAAALAKTGTAPCTHTHRAPGDGFVVAIIPADRPQFLLLVRVHGVPGAKASGIAGRMLRHLEE